MPANSKNSPRAEQAAKRVRYLLARAKKFFLHLELPFASHNYRLVKIPKFQSKLPKCQQVEKKQRGRSIELVSVEKEEKNLDASTWSNATVHAHQCCVNQKHPAFVHLETILAQGSELNAQRVSSWQFKEYLLAARKLQDLLAEQMRDRKEGHKKHRVTVIPEDEPQQQERWEESAPGKNTRLFQVGNIK